MKISKFNLLKWTSLVLLMLFCHCSIYAQQWVYANSGYVLRAYHAYTVELEAGYNVDLVGNTNVNIETPQVRYRDGNVIKGLMDISGTSFGLKTTTSNSIATFNPTFQAYYYGGDKISVSGTLTEISGSSANSIRLNSIGEIALNANFIEIPTGSLLINKTSQTNPSYKLDVNGKIRANEIVVNTTGADYVFEDNYKLKALDEVESFIEENNHLPGIPSAVEMQAEGMSVGELNTKLLEKVEELTLYMIELKKENEEIRNLLKEKFDLELARKSN